MSDKVSKLTNQQLSSSGLKRTDNGEIEHSAEKKARSQKDDNVKPTTNH
jgi:hypothetical protein